MKTVSLPSHDDLTGDAHDRPKVTDWPKIGERRAGAAAPRFLLYSHDALGLGHLRRNVVIARALVEQCPDAAVILATSLDNVDGLGVPDGVDVMRLPALRKVGNGHYAPRRLTIPAPDLLALRSRILEATVESFRPSVLLVDKQPLGVGGELRAALAALRQTGGRAVLGLRDVLDEPDTVRAEWTPELTGFVLEQYSRVLVYGSEAVFDTLRASALPPELQPASRYCGYVTTPVSRREEAAKIPVQALGKSRSRPLVLGTTGGGEDGLRVLEAFVEASAGERWQALAVAGPQLSKRGTASLRRRADAAGVTLRTFVPEFQGWLGAADAVVCMGGYNTISEVLVRGTPAVCVPRTTPRREQLIRARALGSLGLLQVVEPDRLDGPTLRGEIEVALTRSRSSLARAARKSLGFEGAATSAELLLEEASLSGVRRAA